jgi:hypothetical protein
LQLEDAMGGRRHYAVFVFAALVALAARAFSQEIGPIQSYGPEGRLYSSGPDDSYLLTRQSYATEDSTGYFGQIRIVKKYENGGYEEKIMDYSARCIAPFDNMVQISIRESGKDEWDGTGIDDIKNPERFPGAAKKDSSNLYWAACHQQFRKFK